MNLSSRGHHSKSHGSAAVASSAGGKESVFIITKDRESSLTKPLLVRLDAHTVLENVRAVASDHSFPRHIHATWVIGLVSRGVKQFDLSGKEFLAGPGSIFSIPAGEAHTGRAVNGGCAHYSAWFFPSRSVPQSLPSIRASIYRSSLLVNTFLRFEDAVAEDPKSLESQSWLELLQSLLMFGADVDTRPLNAIPDPVRRTTDFLRGNAFRSVTLNELANLEGVGRHHLLREFKRAHGLPPHAYQDGLRIERAKDLLLRGDSIADVAQAVGFSDQAHLTRRMKRLNGYTPGQFARAKQ